MASLTVTIDAAAALDGLRAIQARALSPTPLLDEIGDALVTSTRLRFVDEVSPDGVPWTPSLRARLTGGRTLTDDGHLQDSVTHLVIGDELQVGANRSYAAIHQFGGVIRPRHKKALAFTLANGQVAVVAAVSMPARPYLGISAGDADAIVAMTVRYLSGDRA